MSDFVNIEDLGLDDEALQPADGGGMREPPAKGKYLLEVTECETGTSQAGNRTLILTTAIVGDAEGGPSDEAGKDFTQWFVMGGKDFARRRLKCVLTALSADLSGFNPEEIVGRRFVAEVYHEAYEKEGNDGTVRNFINARTKAERRA